MSDTFYGIPVKSVYNPSLSTSSVLTASPVLTTITVGSTANTVLIGPPSLSIYPIRSSYPYVTSTYLNPTSAYYYDSGIGDNSLSQNEITEDQRYRFLDNHLYKDYDNILKMLKVSDGHVSVLSKDKAESNDISKDSEDVLIKKSDYIGNILTIGKAYKVLLNLCYKYNMKFYDLPHNESLCMKAFAKYVIDKLTE